MKRTGWTASPARPYHRVMLESFVTAFIIYFVVIDPVGNAPIFVAVTQHQDRARKLRTALEGTVVATMIMLFFALCGRWVLAYLNISEAAFRIAGGIILFLVALDMLSARRQQRKREVSTREDEESEPDNVAIFPLATPLLAGPSAIMSVIVVTAGFAGNGFAGVMTGYAALLAVMALTGVILTVTVVAERWLDERVTMVFSRITAIILAGLSVQYVIDGLTTIGIVAP